MNTQLLKSKTLYKITAIVIKYLPSVLALWQIFMTTINYFGITCPVLGLIGGTSLMFLGLLYLLSYLFQYCYLYRIPIGYSLLMNILIMLRIEGSLSIISLLDFYRIFAIITGIFILIFVYVMYKNRNNPKVDPIKNFCNRYCNY